LPCIASYPLLPQAALAELNGLLLPLAVPAVLNSLLLHVAVLNSLLTYSADSWAAPTHAKFTTTDSAALVVMNAIVPTEGNTTGIAQGRQQFSIVATPRLRVHRHPSRYITAL